jgi:hypothetical protein
MAKMAQFLAAFALTYWAMRRCVSLERSAQSIAGPLALACLLSGLLAAGQMVLGTPEFFVRAGLPNNQVYSLFQVVSFPFLCDHLLTRLKARNIPRGRIGVVLVLLTAGMSVTIRDTGLLLAFVAEACLLLFLVSGPVRRWPRVFSLSCMATAILFLHSCVHLESFRDFVSLREYSDVAGAYGKSARLAGADFRSIGGIRSGGTTLQLSAAVCPVLLNGEEPVFRSADRDPEIVKQRYMEWQAAVHMMAAHPFVGVGPANYQKSIGRFYSPMPKLNTSEPFTQNGWLVLGSSIGLPGMLAFVFALALGALRGFTWRNDKCVDPKLGEGAWHVASGASCLGVLIAGFWTPLLQAGTFAPLAVLWALSEYEAAQRVVVRRNWAVLTALLILPAALLLWHLVPKRQAVAGKIRLWREAENPSEIQGPMVVASDPAASGGAMITIPENAGTGWLKEIGGHASYDFTLPASGSFRLWARVKWNDGCGNSFSLQFNNGPRLITGNDAVFQEWHWLSVDNIALPKGPIRVTISNREDGVALDKLLLTDDAALVPQGTWENTFSRSLSEEPLAGWNVPEASPWTVHRTRDCFGMYMPARAPASSPPMLLSFKTAGDFQIDCSFRLLDKIGDISIYCLFNDPQDFYRVQYSLERIHLLRMHGGKEETLSETGPTSLQSAGQSKRVTVLCRNGVITVLVDGAVVLEHVDRRAPEGRCGFGSERGGVVCESYDVRPLNQIYYVQEFTTADFQEGNASNGKISIGDADWSNYKIVLNTVEGKIPAWIRFNVNESGESFRELMVGGDRLQIRSVLNGSVDETRDLPAPTAELANTVSLSIRSLDREVTILAGEEEIGRAVFSEHSPARGRIVFPTSNVRRIEVKGLKRFFDGFGGCDGNNTASWKSIGGTWKVVTEPVDEIKDSLAQLDGGRALTLTGEHEWEDYELRCMVRSSGDNGAGVVLHYQDENTYDLIRWASGNSALKYAGRVEMVQRKAGKEFIVASALLPRERNRWYEILITHGAKKQRLSINGSMVLETPYKPGVRGMVGLFTDQNPGTFFDNVEVNFF